MLKYKDLKQTEEYQMANLIEVFDKNGYEVDIDELILDYLEVQDYKLSGGWLTVNLKYYG